MKIVHYPDPILLKPTERVTQFNRELRNEIFMMFKVMREEKGIGLAANQVGINKSLFIIDVPLSKDLNRRRTFINPTIQLTGEEIMNSEGCLSFPGITVPVKRFSICEITYQNLFKKICIERFEGISAVVCQHEMDHLLGKTFVDSLPDLTRQEILAKIRKYDK